MSRRHARSPAAADPAGGDLRASHLGPKSLRKLTHPKDEARALPEATRWEALHLLIQAAAIDGEVDPSERGMVETVARYLEVDPADVAEQLEAALRARGG